MSKLYDSLSKSSFFIVISGIASLVSLFVSLLQEKFVLWSIFSICFFILLTLIKLVNQNSRMLRRLDDVICDIFNPNVDLEYDEDKEVYISQSPIIIVLTSFLTPETASKEPTILVHVDFPSQLSLDFYYSSEYISKQEVNSNSAKFKVALKSEAIVITIRSINLSKVAEVDFLKSTQKINITFESELLLETKKESVLVSI